MREAVIVSTARTGLAKSHRGGFNNTGGAAMAGHAIKHSIERAGTVPPSAERSTMPVHAIAVCAPRNSAKIENASALSGADVLSFVVMRPPCSMFPVR